MIKGLAIKGKVPQVDLAGDRLFCEITGLDWQLGRTSYLYVNFYRTEKSYDDGAEPIYRERIKIKAGEFTDLVEAIKNSLYDAYSSAKLENMQFTTALKIEVSDVN